MIKMLQRLIGEDIDLVWLPGKALWSVRMDPSQIDQILANLCVNARDAIAGVGKVTIETGRTTFKIYLPRHRVKTDALPEKVKRRPTEHGHETILLVEDEPSILKMTTQMLERLGYTILAAVTPEEAIRLAREHGSDIHLLMTDVIMPEMNGRDLASNLLSTYPNLKRLFMSGYTANVIAHRGVLDDDVNFIQKPFSKQDLSVKLREILDDAKN